MLMTTEDGVTWRALSTSTYREDNIVHSWILRAGVCPAWRVFLPERRKFRGIWIRLGFLAGHADGYYAFVWWPDLIIDASNTSIRPGEFWCTRCIRVICIKSYTYVKNKEAQWKVWPKVSGAFSTREQMSCHPWCTISGTDFCADAWFE